MCLMKRCIVLMNRGHSKDLFGFSSGYFIFRQLNIWRFHVHYVYTVLRFNLMTSAFQGVNTFD